MGGRPAQVVVSVDRGDDFERVLLREGLNGQAAREVASAAIELARAGPERMAAHLLRSGRDQLGISSREDAGVLATAIAAKASLLVTANLRDFVTNDGE